MDVGGRQRLERVVEVYAAGAWARIVPDNPIAFPPSLEVMRRSSDVQGRNVCRERTRLQGCRR